MRCYLSAGIHKRRAVALADYAQELIKGIICVNGYYFSFEIYKFYLFSLKKVAEVNPHIDTSNIIFKSDIYYGIIICFDPFYGKKIAFASYKFCSRDPDLMFIICLVVLMNYQKVGSPFELFNDSSKHFFKIRINNNL